MEQKEIKIVIDIQDASSYSLTPYTVYRALCTEYQKNVENLHNCNFWGMGTACNTAARELYSNITGRPSNVKNLILTYSDAEKAFDLFKQFADIWVRNATNG